MDTTRATAEKNRLEFANSLLKTAIPNAVFLNDFNNINEEQLANANRYETVLLNNNALDLWSGQFIETTKNEDFQLVTNKFFENLFMFKKIVVEYSLENGFELYKIEQDNPNESTLSLLKIETSDFNELPKRKVIQKSNALIVSDGLVSDRYISSYLFNSKIQTLINRAYHTMIVESKTFIQEKNNDDVESSLEEFRNFLNPFKPFLITNSGLNSSNEISNEFKLIDKGQPIAPIMFNNALKLQQFYSEMLAITQSTDTKSERLTAGENIINVQNITLMNQKILNGLNVFKIRLKRKYGLQLEFDLSTKIKQDINQGNNLIIEEKGEEYE